MATELIDATALGALRYAIEPDAEVSIAIMRLFTDDLGGYLSDRSAEEVADALADQGQSGHRVQVALDRLVEHGNLALSGRQTQARSVSHYLSDRARYQLTQRGELVQRQVDALLGHREGPREVSVPLLPGILAGLDGLLALVRHGLDAADPDDVAARITSLFAQHAELVASTRQCFVFLHEVLGRVEATRVEDESSTGSLLDHVQRLADELARYLPQLADRLRALGGHVEALCARASDGPRLGGADASDTARARGLAPGDWFDLTAFHAGTAHSPPASEEIRRLANEATRTLLTTLRTAGSGADRSHGRGSDLLRLATWFDASDDDTAHALWAAAFGLHPARHLSYAADAEGDPVPATASWWDSPPAQVPAVLTGRSDTPTRVPVDATTAVRERAAQRQRRRQQRAGALGELLGHAGRIDHVRVGDDARAALLDLHAQALSRHGRPLRGDEAVARTQVGGAVLALTVRSAPGRRTTVESPSGRLVLRDLELEVRVEQPLGSAG